jgi:tRNA A37 methylthiotransferase MiaB
MNLSDTLHKIGIHKWTDWQYVNPKTCEQERSCEYGDKTQRQTAHIFPMSYYMSGSCNGSCSHCKVPEFRQREVSCVRCGEKLA